tara:strand:+ start:110 stop:247 length:138 start_codon:yes stop_codon:yes gene_type:complete
MPKLSRLKKLLEEYLLMLMACFGVGIIFLFFVCSVGLVIGYLCVN